MGKGADALLTFLDIAQCTTMHQFAQKSALIHQNLKILSLAIFTILTAGMVCLNPLFMCLSLACDQDWIFYLQMIRMRPDCTRMHQIVFSFFLLHQICIFLPQIHQFLLAVTNFWRWIAARTSKQLFLISNQLSLTFRPHRTFACFL